MSGQRFLVNANPDKLEVHDLDNEQTAANQCQIDEIIRSGKDRPYKTLEAAHADGYDNCRWCLSGSPTTAA